MAVTPSGASAPTHTAAGTLRLIPAATRTRRNHGCFLVGAELATVYSSRREAGGKGVLLTLGDGALTLSGDMSSGQAKALARALTAAADAVDTQRRPAKSAPVHDTDDAQRGMTWWNGLTEEDRVFWCRAGLTAMPAEAWAFFKQCTASMPVSHPALQADEALCPSSGAQSWSKSKQTCRPRPSAI